MNVVLVQPEIPPNTGNIARLCAATHSVLHLVEPLGFDLSDRRLKRAGMDYWHLVEWHCWTDWKSFVAAIPSEARFWLIEQGGRRRYTDARFDRQDYLVFGRETAGLPPELLEQHQEQCLYLPMLNAAARSLNLSNCVAIVLYEALRQTGFGGLDIG